MTKPIKHCLLFVILGCALLLAITVGMAFKSPFVEETPIIKLPTTAEVKGVTPHQTKIPLNNWGSAIAFGEKGEIVIAGSSSILLSMDKGQTWKSLQGGKGNEHTSKDGGLTIGSKQINGTNWIDAKQLCYVENAKIISESGRLYLRANCDHSGQLWSVPLYDNSENWYVTYFVPEDEGPGVLAPDLTFDNAGNRILIRALLPEGSAIFTTDDNGNTWRPFWRKSFLGAGVTDFSFVDENTGWILKGNGEILQTLDGGSSWKTISTLAAGKNSYSISFFDKETGYVVGKDGLILITRNNGKSWEDHTRYTSIDWYKVISDRSGTWISGNSDLILGTADGGKTWLYGKVLDRRNVYSKLTIKNGNAWYVQDQTVLEFLSSDAEK